MPNFSRNWNERRGTMAKPELTKDQRAVVDHEGGALLVSAAAGSGKTKVLVDRLLRKVCDPVSPCNVDDFLIITYTKAAASELRNKIAAEISNRLSQDAANRHLRNQLSRIYLAEISTVHSFCSGLLRNYAYMLDIPADFRVAEQAECMELSQRAAESVLQKAYAQMDKHPELQALMSELVHGRDDRRLMSLILATYEKVQCHADPEKWLHQCRDAVSCKDAAHISDTVWGKYLLDDMKDFLSQQILRMQRACEIVNTEPALLKYVGLFADNLALLQRLYANPVWETFYAAEVDFGRLPTIRNCEAPELQNQVKNIRKTCKDRLEKRLRYFTCSGADALAELNRTREPLLGLLNVVEEFSEAFSALKRQKRVVDYSDLEHLAIRLLIDRHTGNPSPVAKEVGAHFREIMVDEYQDSNEVQDTVFRAVSNQGKNLFMVGDVKQSIYRFRLANPDIFLEKYRTYALQDEAALGDPCKILLSMNFRSRKEVLDAVNHVFTTVMSRRVGDLEYGEAEALHTIREFPQLGEPAVELHCIDSSSDDDESIKKQETEAAFVAHRIRELLDGEHYISDGDSLRKIRAEDIVILLRSVSSNAAIFSHALSRQGIRSTSDRSGSVMDTTEYNTLLAWLQVVDNPHQDIPLITAMASPLGGFSADELAAIRMTDKNCDFFDALTVYADRNEKCKSFLDTIADLRQKRRWMGMLELFDEVCRVSKAFYVFGAMRDGVTRTANLQSFRALCQNAVSTGVDSLSALMRYAENLRQQNAEIPAVTASAGGVTIMSIHKSKGLEFPVVFLCDLSRRFNLMDVSEPVLLDKDIYIGCNVFDSRLMMQYPGTAKNAIAVKKRQETISEELRVLYVAMTRAKDRLIMTYCADKLERKLQEIAEEASYPAQQCVAADVSCPGQWVLMSAAVRPEASFLFGGAACAANLNDAPWLVRYHDRTSIEPTDAEGKLQDLPATVQCVSCPEIAESPASLIPSKMTATQLKGRKLDNESAESAAQSFVPTRPRVQPRVFSAETQPLNAAQKGTATHLFMQYCKYEHCTSAASVEEEKQRLVRQHFLTDEQAAAVPTERILQFFRSDLGKIVTGDGQIFREFKFSLLSDAAQYYPDAHGEKIMMQGVVDCFVITDCGIIVIDYKTDHIRPGQEEEKAAFYGPQLMTYSAALERIYKMPVIRRSIYFFATGECRDVT